MVESRVNEVAPGRAAPRPQVLASMTDQQVLAGISRSDEPVSRAELAQLTGLSKPAVSSAATRLTERGVIHAVGIREGRRGGVATLFDINPHHGRSLAVVIHNDSITVQSRDLRGTVEAHLKADLPPLRHPDQLIDSANQLIADVARGHPAPLLAAAVSIANPIDIRSGAPVVLERSVFPEAAIRPRLDLALDDAAHITVDNDVNWATLGEFRDGSLRGCENFIYIYAGRGLGAGLLLNGRLFRGHRGLSGEIGYLRDGARPHLDLTQQLAELGLGTPDAYGLDLERAADILADPLTPAAQRCAEVLASAIANLAIVVNPSAIAFGGPLSAYAGFTAAVLQRVAALSIDPPTFSISHTTPLVGAGLEAHLLALAEVGIPTTTSRLDP